MTPNKYIYAAEVVQQAGISKSTLLWWFAQGKIPEVGRDVRGWRAFTLEEVERIANYANTIESPQTVRVECV